VVWNSCLAHSIYRKIVCRESEEKLQRRLKLYILVTIVPALAASVLMWALQLFGNAIFYCWVHDKRLHVVCLYAWVLSAMLYISIVLFTSQRHISIRAEMCVPLHCLLEVLLVTDADDEWIHVAKATWRPTSRRPPSRGSCGFTSLCLSSTGPRASSFEVRPFRSRPFLEYPD
jgi:hypothetical protein